MTRKQIAVFITICLIWGSTWAAIRVGVTQVPPMELAAIRFLCAGLLMLPIAFARKMTFPRGRALCVTAILGVTMIALQYAIVFTGERRISSGLTAILYASSPLVAALATPWILRKPVPRAALTAMLVGLGGLMLLLRSIIAASAADIVPALMMLVAMLLSTLGSVYVSREFKGVSTFAASALQFLVGGVLLAVASFAFERDSPAQWTHSAIGSLLFLIFFGSIIAFSLYYWLLLQVEPYRVTTVQFIIPVISVLEGTLLLHERIPLMEMLGGLVVLSAVFLVLRVPANDDDYLDILPGNQDSVL